jgi:dihydrofolate reductase
MGRLIVHNAVTVNGAFEAPDPDKWLVLDADSGDASLEQFVLADAMVLGRKTYQGLAAVWPTLADDPALGRSAERINTMAKYLASHSLQEPLGGTPPCSRRPRRQRRRPQGHAPAEPDRLWVW